MSADAVAEKLKIFDVQPRLGTSLTEHVCTNESKQKMKKKKVNDGDTRAIYMSIRSLDLVTVTRFSN